MIANLEESVSRIQAVIKQWSPCLIACSGGIDSLLLATLAHRWAADHTVVVHAIGPAVPAAATQRVRDWASRERWNLHVLDAGEYDNPRYRANLVDRCFHCKSHLYGVLFTLRRVFGWANGTILSGTNRDDLNEYRPGLQAAAEAGVVHPFVAAGMGKNEIRHIARALDLPFADLPASPCLASRFYTGTPVAADLLRAVDWAENTIRTLTDIRIVRCRIREDWMLIETGAAERASIDQKCSGSSAPGASEAMSGARHSTRTGPVGLLPPAWRTPRWAPAEHQCLDESKPGGRGLASLAREVGSQPGNAKPPTAASDRGPQVVAGAGYVNSCTP
jgi:uncharacterized protein